VGILGQKELVSERVEEDSEDPREGEKHH